MDSLISVLKFRFLESKPEKKKNYITESEKPKTSEDALKQALEYKEKLASERKMGLTSLHLPRK